MSESANRNIFSLPPLFASSLAPPIRNSVGFSLYHQRSATVIVGSSRNISIARARRAAAAAMVPALHTESERSLCDHVSAPGSWSYYVTCERICRTDISDVGANFSRGLDLAHCKASRFAWTLWPEHFKFSCESDAYAEERYYARADCLRSGCYKTSCTA